MEDKKPISFSCSFNDEDHDKERERVFNLIMKQPVTIYISDKNDTYHEIGKVFPHVEDCDEDIRI